MQPLHKSPIYGTPRVDFLGLVFRNEQHQPCDMQVRVRKAPLTIVESPMVPLLVLTPRELENTVALPTHVHHLHRATVV